MASLCTRKCNITMRKMSNWNIMVSFSAVPELKEVSGSDWLHVAIDYMWLLIACGYIDCVWLLIVCGYACGFWLCVDMHVAFDCVWLIIKESRCYKTKIEKWKGRQPPGVEPRTPRLLAFSLSSISPRSIIWIPLFPAWGKMLWACSYCLRVVFDCVWLLMACGHWVHVAFFVIWVAMVRSFHDYPLAYIQCVQDIALIILARSKPIQSEKHIQ